MRLLQTWSVVALAAAAILAAATPRAHDLLLYNHSASMPVGFYLREKPASFAVGTIVTVRARDVAPKIAADRHFEGPTDRFIKHVAARAGDRVCAQGDALTINTRRRISRVAAAKAFERVPIWSGCRVLRKGEVLLLGETADSFDGRYWGPVSIDLIEGVWRKI